MRLLIESLAALGVDPDALRAEIRERAAYLRASPEDRAKVLEAVGLGPVRARGWELAVTPPREDECRASER